MRILISALSCNPALGSEALVGFKFAEALARRHEVVVFASPPSQTPPCATLLPCNAGPCSFNEITSIPLFRFELRQFRLARSLRRRLHFDFVHRLTPSAIQVPTWAAPNGQPLVLGPVIAADRPPSAFCSVLNRPVTRSALSRWHPARIAARLCRIAMDRAGRHHAHLRQARRIIVGTRTTLRHVPEIYRDKCRFIPYSGVEHDLFVPSDATDSSLLPIRLGEGSRVTALRLLFVGRVIPYKGIELLLRAVALAGKHYPLHLDILGATDPLYKSYLLNLAEDLGISLVSESTAHPTHHASRLLPPASASFLPPIPREKLPALYQNADIFCFPTICDTFGITLLEAMSCGRPVLVSDVAGAGEVVNDENGLKVPLTTPEQYVAEYAGKLVTLARNPELRSRLGNAARQYILREHDWPRIGNQLLSIYEELWNCSSAAS